MTAARTRDVFADVIGQPEIVATLRVAVAASHGDAGVPTAAMTHAWLFTGPPGSGRSIAARAFAAALECPERGCGHCVHCRTVLHGTHGDVRSFNPEGLSIKVDEMRAVVQAAARRPTTGRWQIVLIEDADRLTEGAANALLKAVEEPSKQTVFLLCAPSTHPDDVSVTIRSRCRVISLGSPGVAAIAEVLRTRDGIDPERAAWAASVCGGHVGRARRLATDPDAAAAACCDPGDPGSCCGVSATFTTRPRRSWTAPSRSPGRCVNAATPPSSRNSRRRWVPAAPARAPSGRPAAPSGSSRELEKRQKSRATRTERDVLDRALIDLSGFYRDVIALALGAPAPLLNPDIACRSGRGGAAARCRWGAASAGRDPGLPGGDRGERETADRDRGADDAAAHRLITADRPP